MKKMFGFVVFLVALAMPRHAPAATPNPYPTSTPQPELTPPPFPPDGTYTYALMRGAQRAGTTRVVVLRRNDQNLIELYESGSLGDVTLRMHAGLRYSALQPSPWDVTYTGVRPIGGTRKGLDPAKGFTVRYLIDSDGGYDVYDGYPGGDVMPLFSMPNRHVLYQMVLDPPFLGGYLAMPATLALRAENYVAPISEAFWDYDAQESLRPLYPKAALDQWPNDVGLQAGNFIVYYDAKTLVVHEASFPKSGIRAHLESYAPGTASAASFGTP